MKNSFLQFVLLSVFALGSFGVFAQEPKIAPADLAVIAQMFDSATVNAEGYYVSSCKADGAKCEYAQDCCSKACVREQCGTWNNCKAAGSSCNFANECCSSSCTSGTCN